MGEVETLEPQFSVVLSAKAKMNSIENSVEWSRELRGLDKKPGLTLKILLGLAVMVLASAFGPLSGANERVQPGVGLTLLSYNVWFNKEQAAQRYPGILSLIANEAVDAAFLQEVTPLFIKHFKASHLAKTWYLYPSPRAKADYGVAYLSKERLSSRKVMALPSQYRRSVFFALRELTPSKYIILANVHLESGSGEEQKRSEQISIIQNTLLPEYLAYIKTGLTPVEIAGVVWAGDFNIEREEVQSGFNAPWQDVAKVVNKDQIATFNLKYVSPLRNLKNWLGYSKKLSRFDRFYMRSDKNAFIVSSYNVLDSWQGQRNDLSDHYPIMTRRVVDQESRR